MVIEATAGPAPTESLATSAAIPTCELRPDPGYAFDVRIGSVLVHLAIPCQWLDRGESWYFGNARLTMQHDGNLVLYDRRYDNTTPRARWASGTNGSGATQMLFQWDGNLVVYTAGYARAVWDSRTWDLCSRLGRPFDTHYLGLQSDSNLVVYCGTIRDDIFYYTVGWATGTVF